MKTIAFLNRKGGTGKTTCSVNVAIQLVELGNSVMLIETDRNYTVDSLREIMTDSRTFTGRRKLSVTHIMDKHRQAIAEVKKNDYDFIIIDGAPNLRGSIYQEITAHCDLVLIPTNTNVIELEPTRMTLSDIAPAAALHPDLKCALLGTRIHPLTSIATVISSLESLHTEVMPFYIPNYKVLGAVPCNTLHVFQEATRHLLDILDSDHYLFNTECYGSASPSRNTVLNINYCQYRHCGKQFTSTRKDAKFCPNPDGPHKDSICKALEAREREMEKRKHQGNLVQTIG